jgi:hypothetical protein
MRLSLAPSGFERWSRCTASPAAIAGVTQDRKNYADEGNVAHELHAMCLMFGITARSCVGKLYINEEIGIADIDFEMADYVDESINYVYDHLTDVELGIEMKLSLEHLVPGQTGYADVAGVKGDELHIIDLKYGKGVKVYAKNNGELMMHASGVLRQLPVEVHDRIKKIVLHISQPRLEHFDRWECSRGDLSHFEVMVAGKYHEAADPERRKFVPSPEGCQFCPIKSDCRALKESIYAKVMGEDGELVDPDRLSDAELAEMYEWFDFIGAWANNAREQMVKRAELGASFPGLKLIPGRAGARDWKSEQEAVKWMTEKGMNDFEIYESTLISPAKAEAQLGKKNVGPDFKEIVTQRAGKPRLVKDSHNAPSVTETKINDFNDV